MKKRCMRFTAMGLAILLVLAYAGIILANNHIAEALEQELSNAPLPPKTELMDSKSHAGKIAGNGNGMQYYAVILISSDLSEDELQAYYQSRLENADAVYVFPQETQYISEYDMWFDCWETGRDCYRVELWKYSVAGLEKSLQEEILNMDIRGH